MSERELNRVEVLSQVTQGAMSAETAANVLGLSRRQVHRLLKDFQTEGPGRLKVPVRSDTKRAVVGPTTGLILRCVSSQ